MGGSATACYTPDFGVDTGATLAMIQGARGLGLMLIPDTAVLNGSCGVRPQGADYTKGFSHRDPYNLGLL